MANRCHVCHNTNTTVFIPPNGYMITTMRLHHSSAAGCTWCSLLWEAAKRTLRFQDPPSNMEEFVYWRRPGESFFEPWLQTSGGQGTRIQIYTSQDIHGNVPLVNQVPRKSELRGLSDVGAVVSQILLWQLECERDHGGCRGPRNNVHLPTRLLDVSNECDDIVKLVRTRGQRGSYFCLSHRWGVEAMPIETTRDTLDVMMAGIPTEALPASFRDAVKVTRAMGCRYLWIDSLCIIQGDADDWNAEADEMASIYRNGSLTIAAAAAAGPNGGLFPAETLDPVVNLPLNRSQDNLGFPVYVRNYLRFQVGHLANADPSHELLDRGWVLQERLLSAQVAYFGFNEVAWECQTHAGCACEPGLQPYDVERYSPRRPYNPKAAFTQAAVAAAAATVTTGSAPVDGGTGHPDLSPAIWHHLVSTYMGLKLTQSADRFPALGGLASEILDSRGDKDEYLAGLWRKTFMHDLLWRRRLAGDWNQPSGTGLDEVDRHNVFGDIDEREQRRFESRVNDGEREEAKTMRAHPAPVAPSWSWASLHAQVEYDVATNSPTFDLVDRRDVAELVEPTPQDEQVRGARPKDGGFRHVGDAFVVIKGRFAVVELRNTAAGWMLYRNDREVPFSDPDFTFWTMRILGVRSGGEAFCLSVVDGQEAKRPRMRKVYALVLVANDKTSKPSYRRIGMLSQSYEPGTKDTSIFDSIEKEDSIRIY